MGNGRQQKGSSKHRQGHRVVLATEQKIGMRGGVGTEEKNPFATEVTTGRAVRGPGESTVGRGVTFRCTETSYSGAGKTKLATGVAQLSSCDCEKQKKWANR